MNHAASIKLAANVAPAAPTTARYDRVEHVAADALDGLEPVVVVNRRTDTAIRQVDGTADRPFPTIHSSRSSDPVTLARRLVRGVNERIRGTHGEGDDAGRTVYGSVRFVPHADVLDGADAVVAALRAQGGDPGVRAYGPVSFVTDPARVGGRTTFASDDSGATGAWVHGREQLPKVVTERLHRSRGSGTGPDPDELLRMPRQAARDAVRGWLLSDDLARSDGYIEAQVRRLAPEDVLATVIDERDSTSVERRPLIDPGTPPSDDQRSALEQHLDRLGVPVHHLV